MFSEVVDLLVSVKIARLKQHLLRDARVHILVHHLNPRIELLGVDLFVANLAVLHDLLLGLVLLLEVALGLQVPIRAHSLETVTLRDKARRVRPSLMVQEGVRVRGLRSESRRRHKLGINLRLEGLSNFVDALSHVALSLPILVQFVLIRNQVRQVKLTLRDIDQTAHIGAELLLEGREIDIAVPIGVEHVLHEERDVTLGGKNLVLQQMRLEVFVADKAVTIRVERSENLKCAWLTGRESSVFDFSQYASESPGCGLVTN